MNVKIHFTGDKKYMMGDQPAEVDCAAYGQLVQMLNTPDSIPGKIFMKGMHIFITITKT